MYKPIKFIQFEASLLAQMYLENRKTTEFFFIFKKVKISTCDFINQSNQINLVGLLFLMIGKL
jgi:hypothetical protein